MQVERPAVFALEHLVNGQVVGIDLRPEGLREARRVRLRRAEKPRRLTYALKGATFGHRLVKGPGDVLRLVRENGDRLRKAALRLAFGPRVLVTKLDEPL